MSDVQLEKVLTGILSRLSVIEQRLTSLEDHEKRLRELEANHYKSAWIISLVSTVITATLVAFISKGLTL